MLMGKAAASAVKQQNKKEHKIGTKAQRRQNGTTNCTQLKLEQQLELDWNRCWGNLVLDPIGNGQHVQAAPTGISWSIEQKTGYRHFSLVNELPGSELDVYFKKTTRVWHPAWPTDNKVAEANQQLWYLPLQLGHYI